MRDVFRYEHVSGSFGPFSYSGMKYNGQIVNFPFKRPTGDHDYLRESYRFYLEENTRFACDSLESLNDYFFLEKEEDIDEVYACGFRVVCYTIGDCIVEDECGQSLFSLDSVIEKRIYSRDEAKNVLTMVA